MDLRVVIVLAPVVIAASWALFNIGSAAIAQFQRYISQD